MNPTKEMTDFNKWFKLEGAELAKIKTTQEICEIAWNNGVFVANREKKEIG